MMWGIYGGYNQFLRGVTMLRGESRKHAKKGKRASLYESAGRKKVLGSRGTPPCGGIL